MLSSGKSGIYQIRNLINGKVYVGSAVDFIERWVTHRAYLRSNRYQHHSVHLQRAWNKYGEEVFVFEILIHCKERLLLCYEQKYMDFFCSYEKDFGYNISPTAGSQLGFRHSEKSKKRMSEVHLGKTASEETKRKMSKSQRKRKATEETKKKMSESRRRISASYSGENSYKAKLIKEQVREIREAYCSGECCQAELAQRYGVKSPTISSIICNRNWKDETLNEDYFRRVLEISKSNITKHSNKNLDQSKLTWDKVREIREKYASGSFLQSRLAREYKVTSSMISYIINGKAWKEPSPQ